MRLAFPIALPPRSKLKEMIMLTEDRPSPFFIGDSSALDFLNSVAAPKTTEYEWLQSGPDLLDWFVEAGMASEEKLQHLRSPEHANAMEDTVQSARKFRDEFRAFIQAASDHPSAVVSHPMIDQINETLGQGSQHFQIESGPSDNGYILASRDRIAYPSDLLCLIAKHCAQLICEADFQYVRNCEGPNCTLYFRDVSKNHKRRWCSMEVCGNRAKVAAHRKR